MIRPRSSLAASALLAACLAGGAFAPSSAGAAAQASARVSPQRVGLGRAATLVASHLAPNKYYYLILSVPRGPKPRFRVFIPKLGKADGKGNMRVTFRMPIVTMCGPASVDAFQAGTPHVVHAPFTLTGCTAPRTSSPPPPPPVKKKHK